MSSTTVIVRVINSKVPSPGPGSYDIPSDFGRAPKYSIKNKYKKKEPEPLPGYQNLGTTIGGGRKSTMYIRPKDKDYTQSPGPSFFPQPLGEGGRKTVFHKRIPKVNHEFTPGPGTYEIATKFDGKRFSIKSRQWIHEEGEIPGPGAGSLLPNYAKTYRAITAASIRPKIVHTCKDKIPAPGDYSIPSNLSNRTSIFHRKMYDPGPEKTPGPLCSPHVFGSDSMKHTIRGRIDKKIEKLDPEIVTLRAPFGNARSASMHSRLRDRDYTQSPGPFYVPPPFGSGARKSQMQSRREKKRDISLEPPGPGTYDPKPVTMTRTYSISSRADVPHPGPPDTPGPDSFDPDYSKVLKSTVSPAIRSKLPEKIDTTTAPYRELGSTLSGPKLTIGRKENVPLGDGEH